MRSRLGNLTRASQPYVVAMVLGTALTAMNAGTGVAAEVGRDGSLRTITDLSRYCTTCWKNARLHPDSWSDCTQEVFSRLMQRVSIGGWDRMLSQDGEERREFLRAIDAVKKRSQRTRNYSSFGVETVADRNGTAERRLSEEREVVDRAASEVLTSRQQEIMRLSLEGWSVQEISEQLNVGPERVSDEKYKAIRKLRERLCDATEQEG
jgi:RNA polymerase sigma factor (sigma-70 family)